jgi:rhamnose transport system substrate-binding protein
VHDDKEVDVKIVKTISVMAAAAAVVAMTLTGCTQRSSGDNPGASASTGNGGGEVSVAFVPKLQGIPYFEAMNTGGQKAAKDLGFTWLYQGPTSADAAAQADIVRSFIQQKVGVLFVAPNDPNSMAPVLKQAQDAGIHIATADTDAPDSARELFVNQATAEGLGQTLTDQLMKAMGDKGEYAIVSCGETAENLNSWIAVQKKYTAEKYPNAKIVDIVYAGEDQAKATQMATDLMNAHPNLTGLVGECTSSAPGVAQAVKDAGKIGKVFTVGLGTPQAMKPYLDSGASSASVLWDVEALGYLTGWAGVQLAKGAQIPAKPDVPGAPDATYDASSKVLLLGPPLVITKDNAGNYNY